MDITLQVMINPSVDSGTELLGDIVASIDTSSVATMANGKYTMTRVIGSPRTGFVHLTDVPVASADDLKRLTLPYFIEPLPLSDAPPILEHKRRYGFLAASILSETEQEMLTEKQVTRPWNVAVGYIWDKVEDRVLTEADF